MKKRIFAAMLAFVLATSCTMPVWATETAQEGTESADEKDESAEEGGSDEEAEEDPAAEMTKKLLKSDNLVDVEVLDLSLHSEEEGDFTPVYAYENPFKGTDTSGGVVLEFYAQPTWEVHELGAIFAFTGSGDYDGKLYFSPGSYLGFNSEPFGGYYDANLYNYLLVTDYIKEGAKMRIELSPGGFAVYADDTLCYDQSILDDPSAGAGDFNASSDFSSVLEWLAGADTLYFGYGSWWNTAGSNEANINLSELSFRLQDGTVVMDQLKADKELVESLGGSVDMKAGEGGTQVNIDYTADVEIFDINSVEYDGVTIWPVMIVIVIVVIILAAAIVVFACKPRRYDDIDS